MFTHRKNYKIVGLAQITFIESPLPAVNSRQSSSTICGEELLLAYRGVWRPPTFKKYYFDQSSTCIFTRYSSQCRCYLTVQVGGLRMCAFPQIAKRGQCLFAVVSWQQHKRQRHHGRKTKKSNFTQWLRCLCLLKNEISIGKTSSIMRNYKGISRALKLSVRLRRQPGDNNKLTCRLRTWLVDKGMRKLRPREVEEVKNMLVWKIYQ